MVVGRRAPGWRERWRRCYAMRASELVDIGFGKIDVLCERFAQDSPGAKVPAPHSLGRNCHDVRNFLDAQLLDRAQYEDYTENLRQFADLTLENAADLGARNEDLLGQTWELTLSGTPSLTAGQ